MKHHFLSPAAVFLLTILSLTALSQKSGQRLIDSLQNELPKMKEDTPKVKALQKLSSAWYHVNIKKSFAPANEGLRLAEKLHWKKGIANLTNDLALSIADTGNNTLARTLWDKCYAINKEIDNKSGLINNLVNTGRSYLFEGAYPTAADYYFKALPIAEAIHSEQLMAVVSSNLASCFLNQKDYPKSLKYAELMLDHAGKAHKVLSLMRGFQQRGDAKFMLRDTAEAKRDLDSAVAFAERAGDKVDMADFLVDRAAMESGTKEQIALNLRAEKLLSEVSPTSYSALINSTNLGSEYLLLAKDPSTPDKSQVLQKAETYLQKAQSLSFTINSHARLADILLLLVDLEETKGNYKTALDYHKRATSINDSLFSQEKKNEIAGLEGKHTIALKDDEIALNQLKLSNQRKTTLGLIAGLALFSIIGILLYRQSRNRKKANTTLTSLNQQLYEANQVKARFFGILSHDLREPITQLLHFLHIQKVRPGLLDESQETAHRQDITREAENLLSTMEDMLLWSKQQMGSFKPNIKSMHVKDLFEYLQKFFGKPENVRLIFEEASELTLTSDENYLRTIMQNLTSNAVKVLKDIPGTTVEWKVIPGEKSTILSIADNGPGLSPDQAKALTNESITDNARDGFGFHVIRDLAKAIQCQLEVKTEPGKGTIFSLIIPTGV